MAKTAMKKVDPAGVISAAKEMVAQLQSQAKDGQIDGSMLDQLGGVLDVSFDTAEDAQSEMADKDPGTEAASMTTATSSPTPSVPEMTKDSGESAPSEIPSGSSVPSEVPSMSTDKSSEFGKGDQPLSSRPPTPAFIFDHKDEMAAQLPQFISALEAGSLNKAQRIAGGQQAFDTMFNMAMRAVMTEGGITYQNMSKLHSGAPASINQDLNKAMTSGDVPGIYLIRLAKLMLPVYAGLRRRLPAATPTTGSNQATWRAQIGFGSLSFANLMDIAEAAIGEAVPTSFLTFNSPYKDTSLNDSVTLKAIAAARGYDDPLQIAVIRAMTGLLQAEERNIIGQNAAALSAPGTITASGSTTGGSLAAGSYVVGVTALSYRGWLGAVKGVATSGSVAGETTAAFATTVVTTGATSQIALTWAAVPGAVAYNVYITASGSASASATWNKTVKINKAFVTAAGAAVTVPPTANGTANANGYEGLIQWCEQSTILGNAIPSHASLVDNSGGALTAQNGGIEQFDQVLADLWTNWQIAPSLMVMSPNMSATVTGKLLSLNSASLYRIEVSNERGTMNGGAMVTGYVNKFAPFADGTPRYLDILPHPYMPDGTALFMTETIPYPMSRESRGFALDVLIPYTYFPLAQTTIQYPFALTLSETLECFHPAAQTALVGVDHTL